MGMFIILYATLICKNKQDRKTESYKDKAQQSDKTHNDKSKTRKRKYSKSKELFMSKSRYV